MAREVFDNLPTWLQSHASRVEVRCQDCTEVIQARTWWGRGMASHADDTSRFTGQFWRHVQGMEFGGMCGVWKERLQSL